MERTCVVTGAAGGIGMAAVQRFLASGHRVLACGRAGARLEQVRQEWVGNPRCEVVTLDVTDRGAVADTFATFGPIDVVVVNAGICRQARLDEAHAEQVWDEVLDVNLNGAFHCLRAASRALVDGGAVVTVSSGLGKNARAGYEAYCAAKHGLLGLTKCVALELAPRKIRVNAVCPGWVDTQMARTDLAETARRAGSEPEALQAQALAAIPLGRMVAADEVAGLIHWLASPDAAAITGQAYNISCGEFFN